MRLLAPPDGDVILPVPPPSPIPSPPAELGRPPAATDLIWYLPERSTPDVVEAATWDGKPVGTVHISAGPHELDNALPTADQAPDGSRFIYGSRVFDRGGLPMFAGASLPDSMFPGIVWADDSRHLCGMRDDSSTPGNGEAQTLYTLMTDLNQRPTSAHDLGRFGFATGQASVDVVACSYTTGRAVLAQGAVWNTVDEWVVGLSRGQVIQHLQYSDPLPSIPLLASRDGNVLAEPFSPPGGPSGPTIARTLPGRKQLGRFDAQAVAFSWDGTELLERNPLQIVEWRTGRVVWAYSGTQELDRALPRPHTTGFALAMRNPPVTSPPGCTSGCSETTTDDLDDIIIVNADGSIARIRGRHVPLWRR
jgi:hypothetical protein